LAVSHIDSLSIPVDGELRHDFIVDCARFAEGILTEKTVKKKYRFDDNTWERLGSDEALIEAIEIRGIRDGSTASERAQVLFAETPTVLGSILHDDDASARHRIESARELRQIAANGPEAAAAAASDRFQIIINLGDDVLKFDKSIEINPNDADPHNTAQRFERAALDFVGRGDAGDGCERKVPELARLLTAAGDHPIDDNAQSANAANLR
jgi:hypothetical protein